MVDVTKTHDAKPATAVGTAAGDAARRGAEAAQQNSRAAIEAMRRGAEAVQQNARAAEDAARRDAEAIRQNGHAAVEAARRGAEATTDVARQGTQAGAEAMRQMSDATTETLRRSAEAVVEGQRQIAQDAAERFEEASFKLAQAVRGTSEDVSRMFTLPKAAEGGLRDMQQGVTGMVEAMVQTNLRAVQEMFRLSNPVAVVELQQRFMREYLDTMMQSTVTLVRAVRHTADQTLRPLEEQLVQRQQAQRDVQSCQHAAE